VLTFYAESVWTFVSARYSGRNALEVEALLAALADIVVIVVESPGTFAELGAFANSDPLRRKLLPLLDRAHRHAESFVTTGPVRWIDAESVFRPSLWLDLDRLLASVDEIEHRLDTIADTRVLLAGDLGSNPKHLTFLVCDLIAVFGPCPAHHLTAAIEGITGKNASSLDLSLCLGLALALGLIRSFHHDGMEMFYRPLDDGRLRAFQRRHRGLDIPTLRAEVLSAMLACPPSRAALDAFGALA
jgi:hypothetical protein